MQVDNVIFRQFKVARERIQVVAIGIDKEDLIGTGEEWVTRQVKETGWVGKGDWLPYRGKHWREKALVNDHKFAKV